MIQESNSNVSDLIIQQQQSSNEKLYAELLASTEFVPSSLPSIAITNQMIDVHKVDNYENIHVQLYNELSSTTQQSLSISSSNWNTVFQQQQQTTPYSNSFIPGNSNQPWFTLPSYRYKSKCAKKNSSISSPPIRGIPSPEYQQGQEYGSPSSSDSSGKCSSSPISRSPPGDSSTSSSPMQIKSTEYNSYINVSVSPQLNQIERSNSFERMVDPTIARKKRKSDAIQPQFADEALSIAKFDLEMEPEDLKLMKKEQRISSQARFLPQEILLYIFSFLSTRDLSTVATVCLYFNYIIESQRRSAEKNMWTKKIQTIRRIYRKDDEAKHEQELQQIIYQCIQPKDWRAKFKIEDLKKELINRGYPKSTRLPRLKAELQKIFEMLLAQQSRSIVLQEGPVKGIDMKKIGNPFLQQLPTSVSYPRNSNFISIHVVDCNISPGIRDLRGHWVRFHAKVHDAVQAAFSGDIILINPGIHDLEQSCHIQKNLEFIGNGKQEQVILRGAPYTERRSAAALAVEHAHVRFFNLTIEQNECCDRTETTVSCMFGFVELDSCNIRCSNDGIVLDVDSFAIIKNTSLSRSSGAAIRISASSREVILHCNDIYNNSLGRINQSPELLEDVDLPGHFAAVQIETAHIPANKYTLRLFASRNNITHNLGHAIAVEYVIQRKQHTNIHSGIE